jgi:hypothetical protein
MGSFSHILTWYLWLNSALFHRKSCFLNQASFSATYGMALFQNPSCLCYDFPTEICHKLCTASFSTINISSSIRFAKSYGLRCKAACIMLRTYCKFLSSSRPYSKVAAFHVTQYMNQNHIAKCQIFCLHNQSWVSLLVAGNVRYNHLFFTVEGEFHHVFDNLTSPQISLIAWSICIYGIASILWWSSVFLSLTHQCLVAGRWSGGRSGREEF